MKLDADDFELFGLPRRYVLDRSRLDERWKALQSAAHPDRHSAAGAAAQRVAMQWSVRINGAYRRLKDPISRAAYLCELHGAPVDTTNNKAMPPAFLIQQMQWREALEEAADAQAIEALADEMAADRQRRLEELAVTLDQRQDFASAAEQVKALMFVERFADDVEMRRDALGQ